MAIGIIGIMSLTAIATYFATRGGESKKEAAIAQDVPASLTIAPLGVGYTYAPQVAKQIDIIIDSPSAETGSKKIDQMARGADVPITQTPSAGATVEQSDGIDFVTIAIIAAIGLVGYGLIKD